MNGPIVALIVTALLMGFFPVAYFTGWFITMPALYFVVFKESVRKADKLTDKKLSTTFSRWEDESTLGFMFRRVVSFGAWNLTTVTIYWFLILYVIGSQKRLDEITGQIAQGIAS